MKSQLSKLFLFICFLVLISCLTLAFSPSPTQPKVLIIQDEPPQMEVLAKFLRGKGSLSVTIIDQQSVPKDLAFYKTVIVFIHRDLREKTEMAITNYTKNGGKLICLHHSISSGKAQNKFYFDFLGMQLNKGSMEEGGYKWKDGSWTLVSLNSQHYITNYKVDWEDDVAYTPSDFPSVEKSYPCIKLKEDSEAFINHMFKDGREKTVLCGLIYTDKATGKIYMQDRGMWIKKQGKGTVVYFMPGHSVSDYKNDNIAQIILNAVKWD